MNQGPNRDHWSLNVRPNNSTCTNQLSLNRIKQFTILLLSLPTLPRGQGKCQSSSHRHQDQSRRKVDFQVHARREKGNIKATAAFLRTHWCQAPWDGNLCWQVLLFFNLTLTIPAGLPVLSAKEVSDEGGSLHTWWIQPHNAIGREERERERQLQKRTGPRNRNWGGGGRVMKQTIWRNSCVTFSKIILHHRDSNN